MSKILIIEDEAAIRRVLTKILSEENDSYKVEEAEHGLQGIEKVKNEDYDLILCDIKMPKMDGVEVLEAVKNGEVLWQTDIKGSIEREIATGKILASMKMIGTKVLLTMQGLQAYDLNNGSLVWSVTHSEEVMREISGGIGAGYAGRKFVRKAVYGAVAEPLIDGNDVYVFDMQSKKQQYVSKYDLNTGKLIWKSKELKKLTIAPNLYKVGNRIVIQIGGWAQVQGIVENKQNEKK